MIKIFIQSEFRAFMRLANSLKNSLTDLHHSLYHNKIDARQSKLRLKITSWYFSTINFLKSAEIISIEIWRISDLPQLRNHSNEIKVNQEKWIYFWRKNVKSIRIFIVIKIVGSISPNIARIQIKMCVWSFVVQCISLRSFNILNWYLIYMF